VITQDRGSAQSPGTTTAAATGAGSAPIRAVADLVREHAARDPRSVALEQDGRRLTYGELDGIMERVAASLQRDGCAPGDVAAICAGTSIEYAAVFLGALRAGVVAAPLPPSATPEQLAAMAADSGARHLFLDAANADAIARGDDAEAPRRVALDGSGAGEPLAAWLVPEGARARPVAVDADAAFNIIYSSGTTGTPKGIVQPHRMRWMQVRRYARFGLGAGIDITVVFGRIRHNDSLAATGHPADQSLADFEFEIYFKDRIVADRRDGINIPGFVIDQKDRAGVEIDDLLQSDKDIVQ